MEALLGIVGRLGTSSFVVAGWGVDVNLDGLSIALELGLPEAAVRGYNMAS